MKKPNIVFVLVDQMSAHMIGGSSNPYVYTPHLDALCQNGVVAKHAYCANPVCLPSRTAFLTGRKPGAFSIRSDEDGADRLPDDVICNAMGWTLKKAGYDVWYGGKDGLNKLGVEKLGFDVFETDARDRLVDRCIQKIRTPSRKPFLLTASLVAPHDICYMAIHDFLDHAGDEKKAFAKRGIEIERVDAIRKKVDESNLPPLPASFEPQADEPEAVRHLLEKRGFRIAAREHYTEKQWRIHRYVYAKLVEEVDRQIGAIAGALDDNTVMIITSDHGDMDAAHRMEHKSVMYRECMCVPLIIYDKRSKRTVRIERPMNAGLDIYPTVLALAGISPDFVLDGLAINEAMGLNPVVEYTPLHIEGEVADAIVTKEAMYVRYRFGAHAEQLYDLESDPAQTRNHKDDPALQPVLTRMRAWCNLPRGKPRGF